MEQYIGRQEKTYSNKATFKQVLNKIFGIQPLDKLSRSLFLFGDRNIQIIMSQMRLEFSNLNSHLYSKLYVDYALDYAHVPHYALV